MANGVELATAYVSLTVDGSQVDRGVRKGLSSVPAQADRVGRDSGRRMGDKMSKGIVSSVGRIAGPLAAIFATVGIGKFLSGTLDEAREAQKVSATTDAIVKATGGVAKVSAKHVNDLADALSAKIGVDDEAIAKGANLLLTFKRIRDEAGKGNNIFDRAVTSAQDLSKAGFGSIESASKTLGKALNDPVKGIAALGRAGVTFTDAQKEQIKKAVKNNDLLTAQKIILGEVETQVGGVAEAAATTGDKVRVAFDNMKEKIGTAILPILDKVGNWFLTTGLPKIEEFGSKVKGVFQGLADLLGKGEFTSAVRDAFGVEEDSAVVSTLLAIREFAIASWERLKTLGSYIKDELWPALVDGFQTVRPGLEKAQKIIGDTFGGTNGAKLTDFGKFITDVLIPGIATLVNVWLPVAATQFSLVVKAVEGVWGAMQFLLTIQRTVFLALFTGLLGITDAAVVMLDALSVVPGFGWAKGAADKLRGVSDKARAIKDGIESIPTSWEIDVTLNLATNKAYQDFRAGERDQFGVGRPGDVVRKRVHGGPVVKGQPYIVGEKRPELFVPNQSGMIVPRVPAASASGAAGGGIDYYRLAGAVASEMRHLSLAVDTRQNVVESARYANTRGQM